MTRSIVRRVRRAACLAALLAVTLSATTPPAHRPRPGAAHATASAAARKPAPLSAAAKLDSLRADALSARAREDEGAFGSAAKLLRSVRARTAPDADLELWLALDEARSGQIDSAWARLGTPALIAATADTAPPQRWQEYGERRPVQWLDGRFTGWHWYVARARAELALDRGDWSTAEAAASVAVHAQPLVGREHLLLALAAGRAGDAATARAEAALARTLDPLLPEAHYLAGVWAWRDGDRAAARAAFESAIAADSGYREPALALVRLQLPGTRPDTLPVTFLHGIRRVAMLTASERPKPEEIVATDTPAGLFGDVGPSLVVPESLAAGMQLKRPIKLLVTVLVDERGKPTLSYFPYIAPGYFPIALMHTVLSTATQWKFRPATRFGAPIRAWVSVEFWLYPPS